MAFYGCEFIFDGIPCTEYGLMVYNFGSYQQGDADIPTGEMVEERIAGRYDTQVYGIEHKKVLEFSLVFGASMDCIDGNNPMDRYDVEAIAAWLTGHSEYKYLEIVQPDMQEFRYKCVISEMKLATFGGHPWAFSCKVTCDSPYAYTYPEQVGVVSTTTQDIQIYNRASYRGFYKPKVIITMNGGTSVSITNHSDNNRTMSFTGLPTGSLVITVDCLNQVITNNLGYNLYQYFNMKFLRLLRGDNNLTISGNADVQIVCEYPVNIGG